MVARRLAHTTLWVGDEAAEDALKHARLEQYGLLHFAAHAIADVFDGGQRSHDRLANADGRDAPGLRHLAQSQVPYGRRQREHETMQAV